MKQNDVKVNNGMSKDFEEIENLYRLLLIKYPNVFDNKTAYKIAEVLYENGIRTYMFFDNKFDIDEIVYYIASKLKVIKFIRSGSYSFSNEDSSSLDSGKIINLEDYLRKRKK